MAYLQPNYLNIWSRRCHTENQHYFSLLKINRRWKNSVEKARITKLKRPSGEERRVVWKVHCRSTSNSSSVNEVELAAGQLEVEGNTYYLYNRRDGFGSLLSEHGWHIRRMVETDEEMRKVAGVQAEAFHEPVVLFNDFFFEFFQAEVLSGLLYRLRNSPPDRYACLVAEPSRDTSGSNMDDLVGVVDVTVSRDDEVLQYISGADEYLYVSGIAVLNNFRRKKVATALLKACDRLCNLWGFEYLVLRAYEDDWGARELYSNAGYRVVSGDPAWLTTWIGRRRRVLMIKECDNT
ncbi:GCN5-related N-acetyltransferase 10, chloroplastic [Coffea arabica]|uniref:GCN5-related N-acetyltransferase 10, chloroplastic n=1 Tax=Coffea arabica TaxID=13443 RepID=A0A6P6UJQ2_COFAR|nr:uncharacterized protein LOC113711046 [Coffea arabica]